MPKVRFIIAEKSYLLRQGLVSAIQSIANAMVIEKIENINELSNLPETDYLIVSGKWIKKAPLQANEWMQLYPKMKIIVLIGEFCPAFILNDYSLKIEVNSTKASILKTIQSLVDEIPQLEEEPELTKREQSILREIALGLSNKEIAEKLFISTHTVITHRKNIIRKLDIKSVSGLTVYAILNQIISIDEV